MITNLLKSLLISKVVVEYSEEFLKLIRDYPFLPDGKCPTEYGNNGKLVLSKKRYFEVYAVCRKHNCLALEDTKRKYANFCEVVSPLIGNRLNTEEILEACNSTSKYILNLSTKKFSVGFYDCISLGAVFLYDEDTPAKGKLLDSQYVIFSFCIFLLSYNLINETRYDAPGLYHFFSKENILLIYNKHQKEHPEFYPIDKTNPLSVKIGSLKTAISSLENVYGESDHSNLLYSPFYVNYFGGLYLLVLNLLDSGTEENIIVDKIQLYNTRNGGAYVSKRSPEIVLKLCKSVIKFCKYRLQDPTFELKYTQEGGVYL